VLRASDNFTPLNGSLVKSGEKIQQILPCIKTDARGLRRCRGTRRVREDWKIEAAFVRLIASTATIPRIAHLKMMTNFADTITDHFESHALAWDAERRNGGWKRQALA
jgi:hypothetical protein